ncbi:hypothetical protein B0T20DRAFT_111030 [Sordaria brevicollis]|uniref:Uncharacterized protein n=1 Tax=Sordaria brevicollis TaxID=83679 RepID=A0AAE0NRG0_SORBR|nr:hypothetical protein B0T20DRAFT_111030 [Sordaria brevicollis]
MTKNILRSLFPSRSRGGSPSNSAPASRSGSRSATPAPSQPASRSPSPVPATSYAAPTSNLSLPGSAPGSRAPSPSPFSLAASLPPPKMSLPAAPGSGSDANPAGPEPTPTPAPTQAQAQPRRKISASRLAQLHTLLTILNLTKASLLQEQESMADILLATTVTHAESRVPSPESRDIDLLALASRACRARRYFFHASQEAEETKGLDLDEEKEHWQGVVDELGRTIERLEKEVEGLEREREVLEGSW